MNRIRKSYSQPYWGAIILEFFSVLQDADLSASDYRIFFFLVDKMNRSDNMVQKRQKEISDELHMDKSNVSRSIKKLCKKQFIAKKMNGVYFINPHLLYVGPHNREELRDNFDELIVESNLKPRFEMNEDFRILQIYDEKDNHLDYPF